MDRVLILWDKRNANGAAIARMAHASCGACGPQYVTSFLERRRNRRRRNPIGLICVKRAASLT
ncbi:MAG TPA: hypothetical protein VFV71_01125 [Burkholderiales bacterium]|nr:hypothetical protein [Burkholderiales bacterium]